MLKFSFSEKAKKICAICNLYYGLDIYKYKSPSETAQIFVAFSGKVSFQKRL